MTDVRLKIGLITDKELELIQSHMAQKPVLRGEVGCTCVAREVSVEDPEMTRANHVENVDWWLVVVQKPGIFAMAISHDKEHADAAAKVAAAAEAAAAAAAADDFGGGAEQMEGDPPPEDGRRA